MPHRQVHLKDTTDFLAGNVANMPTEMSELRRLQDKGPEGNHSRLPFSLKYLCARAYS